MRGKPMSSVPEQWVKECTKNGWLDYSDHAKCRMKERKIEDKKVVECILYGKVIELQPQFKDVHVVFQEPSENKPEIYVIIAAAHPYPVVVTVCRTINEVWEYCDGYLKRRR